MPNDTVVPRDIQVHFEVTSNDKYLQAQIYDAIRALSRERAAEIGRAANSAAYNPSESVDTCKEAEKLQGQVQENIVNAAPEQLQHSGAGRDDGGSACVVSEKLESPVTANELERLKQTEIRLKASEQAHAIRSKIEKETQQEIESYKVENAGLAKRVARFENEVTRLQQLVEKEIRAKHDAQKLYRQTLSDLMDCQKNLAEIANLYEEQRGTIDLLKGTLLGKR